MPDIWSKKQPSLIYELFMIHINAWQLIQESANLIYEPPMICISAQQLIQKLAFPQHNVNAWTILTDALISPFHMAYQYPLLAVRNTAITKKMW